MRLFSKSSGSSSSSSLASTGVAALGGVQISLKLLEKLMDGVPVPFVKGAAGAALEVITMLKGIHTNRKECDELVQRTQSLLIVILGSFMKKTAEEIPDGLKDAVERLATNFHEVLAELRIVDKRAGKKSFQGFINAGLYHSDNTDKLRGCSAKLDWAMQMFQVTSKVDSCMKDLERYDELRRGQKELKDGQVEMLAGQTKIQDGQAEIRETQNKILNVVKEKEAATALSSLPTTVMPADPKIFGRQDYVARAVDLLLSSTSARMAILGPGGMGKTSVALKIVHDNQVKTRFGKNCHWVLCEQATTLGFFVELLGRSLHLPSSSSNDRFEDVVTALESSSDPHLFLLDNFETVWDIPGHQSDVAGHLARLCSIPSTSFILTMRGDQHPSPRSIDWSMPRLPSLSQLDIAAARVAFLQIAPDTAGDPMIDTLLQELDCMPLAITLMATISEAGEMPSKLLLEWRSERTGLLAQADGDRSSCIEVSIKLSLESRAVKAYPEAISLLKVLAVLPGGASLTRLPEICPSITNLSKALRVLRGAALIYDSPDNTFVHVLSPIRSYILLHHPLDIISHKTLHSVYCKLVEKGNSQPGYSDFLDNVRELSQERANIETILLGALSSPSEDKDEIINASLSYSSYLYWIQPQVAILVAAVYAARASGSVLLAKCLQLLGNILRMQSKYTEAQSALEEARAEFLKLGSPLGATQCLQSLGDILRMQSKYTEAQSALEEARAEFIKLGEPLGATQCLQSLGDILWMQSKYTEAQEALEGARAEFIKLGEPLGAAQCLRSLGDILWMQSKYTEAQSALEEARAEFIKLGSPLGATQCLQSLGDILWMQSKYTEAQSALEDARAEFIKLGSPLGAAQCLRSLGDILRMQSKYTEAQSALEDARAEFLKLGSPLGATQCLQSLGNILQMQSKYTEAQSALEEARAEFIKLGYPLGVTQCLDLIQKIDSENRPGPNNLNE